MEAKTRNGLFLNPPLLGRLKRGPTNPRLCLKKSCSGSKGNSVKNRQVGRSDRFETANGRPDLTPREHQPRRAALIAATSIFFMPIMASNARFASAPPAASASVSTRGVICQETPHLSLHQPHALSWPPLPTMAFQ